MPSLLLNRYNRTARVDAFCQIEFYPPPFVRPEVGAGSSEEVICVLSVQ